MLLLQILPILSLHFSHAAAEQWSVGQEVKTTSGLVQGHASKKYPETSEYLGIRFGETTAGKNRFMPPKRYTGDGKIDAAVFGAACPQVGPPGVTQISSFTIPTNVSEDCLFVNVWTKPQVGEKKKAVLLWIYGGGFNMGDTSTPNTNGAPIANNQDVVVVSINYRINIFGFPGAPTLTHMNPALLDQRLGVEWARDNVAAFGGDPERITIYGESAGGSSVDYYAFAWTKDPIVNGFIASSGTAMMPAGALGGKVQTGKAWYDLSQKLGCGGAEAGPSTVDCVQTKTMKEVQGAMSPMGGGGTTAGLTGGFGPSIDNQTIFGDIYARAKAGNFIQKPILIGANQNESLSFAGQAGKTGQASPRALPNTFGCATADSAKARTLAKVPVWRYHFANNKPGSTLGAAHGADIQYVFGDGLTGLSKLFQSSWAAFTKDPANGLSKLGWPKYDPDAPTLVRLAFNGEAAADFPLGTTFDGDCKPQL